MSTEERWARLENAFVNLTRLAESFDDRLNTQLSWINSLGEAQTNSEAKIAAIASAQIKTEEAQANSESKIAALADAQIRTEEALVRTEEALVKTEEALVRLAESHTKLSEAHTKLSEAHRKLAESQSHTDQRLDALIDIVRESRNGKS